MADKMEAGTVIHPDGKNTERTYNTPIGVDQKQVLPSLGIPDGISVKMPRGPAIKQMAIYFIVFYVMFTAAGLLYVSIGL